MRLVLAFIVLASVALALTPYWLRPFPAYAVAVSPDGRALAATPSGLLFFSKNGTVTGAIKGSFVWAGYSGQFVATGNGKVYIIGNVTREMVVPVQGPALLVGKELVVCGSSCYALTLEGKVLWKLDVPASGSLAASDGKLYVPSYSYLLVVDLKSGKVLKKISAQELGGLALSAASCGRLVAVSTTDSVALVEGESVKWVNGKAWGYSVAFSPNCSKVAVTGGKALYLLSSSGSLLETVKLWKDFVSVSWEGSWVALGSPQGGVLVMSR